jgi:hypothetical protein
VELAEIGDRLAIADILHRYTRIIDRGEIRRLDEVFTADGRFRVVDLPSGDQDFTIAEFADYLADTFAACNFMQHFISNTIIELDGDRASADSYLAVMYELKPDHQSTAFGLFDQTTDLFLGGEYRDDFVRTQAGWRIRTRTARFFSQRVRPLSGT